MIVLDPVILLTFSRAVINDLATLASKPFCFLLSLLVRIESNLAVFIATDNPGSIVANVFLVAISVVNS